MLILSATSLKFIIIEITQIYHCDFYVGVMSLVVTIPFLLHFRTIIHKQNEISTQQLMMLT